MDALRVPPTSTTPSLIFDKAEARFQIEGRSIPADVVAFYTPVTDWLEAYRASPLAETNLHIELDYFNSGSAMALRRIIHKLEGVPGARVSWYHQADDEDILEAGQHLNMVTKVPFHFLVIHA